MIGRLPRHHARTVLLPSYVAEGVIRPFLVSEFTVFFYRLEPDLSPLVKDIETILEQMNGVVVVVLIHYFGFSARSAELSSALERHGPVVIDDFAHAPFAMAASGEPLVETAQLGLFSLNKFLPVVDGAILISNRPDIDLSMDESALPELPGNVQQAYQHHLQSARELFESKDPAQASIALRNLKNFYEEYYSAINSDLRPYRQSVHSRRVEEAFAFEQMIEQRSANSRILYEGLRSSVFSLVHPTLPLGVVPFCIPARVPVRQRTEILAKLFEQGILLSTLQDKWDFIPANQRSHYAVEAAFLDAHVLIPVSEFITAVSMWYLVKQLNRIQVGFDRS